MFVRERHRKRKLISKTECSDQNLKEDPNEETKAIKSVTVVGN